MGSVAALHGRINDVDSHEMIPINLWPTCFGDIGGMLVTLLRDPAATSLADMLRDLDVDTDVDERPITYETVWQHRGWERQGALAPGAIDLRRRLDVLDFMGVKRQQVFPSFALIGLTIAQCGPGYIATMVGEDAAKSLDSAQFKTIGKMMFRAYNDWAIEQTNVDDDRLRLVAVIPTADFNEMMAETERVIAGGVRSLWIPASVPPGGKSPADRAIGPFWSLCEAANVTVQLHLGFESFMQTDVWGHIPEFQVHAFRSLEFTADPWTLATVHMAPANFLTTMILGGVFERHPQLRFGVIECGAYWLGPLAETLDMWAKVSLKQRQLQGVLSVPPSTYLARNVRVTPFLFEPIASYFERYGLEDVFCYGSDYPHPEGGKSQIEVFGDALAPLGGHVMEKFFVTNGDLLMPPKGGASQGLAPPSGSHPAAETARAGDGPLKGVTEPEQRDPILNQAR